MDFLELCVADLRQQADALKGMPVAVLSIVIDEYGNQTALVTVDSHDDAEHLARCAAATATRELTDALDGQRIPLSCEGGTLQ